MELKVVSHNGDEVGRRVRMRMERYGELVRDAMREAAQETADFILFRVQEDISSAGNFGGRWTDAVKADVTETQRTVTVTVSVEPEGPPVSYWKVFEYGADIVAKNPSGMMWIPFDRGNDVWPRDYPGELYRAGNVLFDEKTDSLMYFGTPQVHIPKKFHIHEIAEDEAKKANATFQRLFRELKE